MKLLTYSTTFCRDVVFALGEPDDQAACDAIVAAFEAELAGIPGLSFGKVRLTRLAVVHPGVPTSVGLTLDDVLVSGEAWFVPDDVLALHQAIRAAVLAIPGVTSCRDVESYCFGDVMGVVGSPPTVTDPQCQGMMDNVQLSGAPIPAMRVVANSIAGSWGAHLAIRLTGSPSWLGQRAWARYAGAVDSVDGIFRLAVERLRFGGSVFLTPGQHAVHGLEMQAAVNDMFGVEAPQPAQFTLWGESSPYPP